MISLRANELFAGESFKQCDHEMLVRILKLDSLRCIEAELFDACIAWARVACLEKHVDASQPTNLRAELGDAITQVRFSSMKFDEFVVRHRKLDGFFTLEESNEIFFMIGKVDGFES